MGIFFKRGISGPEQYFFIPYQNLICLRHLLCKLPLHNADAFSHVLKLLLEGFLAVLLLDAFYDSGQRVECLFGFKVAVRRLLKE